MNPIINIENLRKSYDDREVLKGINLKVYPGEIIGYIGPNGAGKSTTIKILLGLIDDYTGNIEICGNQINTDEFKYKKQLGYVPEKAILYENLTSREYFRFIGGMYGLDEDLIESKAKKMSEVFGINESFDTRLNVFSKGSKQKVMIISALMHNPDIYFLDEPLSGMDANSVMIVKELLNELSNRGKTIFYSSHIMEVVEKLSSRIVLINDGEIVIDASLEEVKKSKDIGLESIFAEVTGFENSKHIAQSLVRVMEYVHD